MGRKSVSVFSFTLVILTALFTVPARAASPTNPASLFSPQPGAKTNPGAYELLKDKAAKIEETNSTNGWGYIISGGLAVAISVPAYFLTEDVFARTVYSLGETLGVASVGYGSYLVSVQDDTARFGRIISQSSLSPKQRDELSFHFLSENAKRARAVRKIRVITHSLTAGLNFLNGFTTDSRELRTALFFVGGINLLATVHYLFSESEEEKFFQRLAQRNLDVILSPGPSPLLGLQYRF